LIARHQLLDEQSILAAIKLREEELQAQLTKKTEESAALQKVVEKCEAAISGLQEKVEQLQAQIFENNNRFELKQLGLEAEVEKLRSQNAEKDSVLLKFKDELCRAHEHMKRMGSENEEEIKEKDKKIRELEERLSQADEQIERMKPRKWQDLGETLYQIFYWIFTPHPPENSPHIIANLEGRRAGGEKETNSLSRELVSKKGEGSPNNASLSYFLVATGNVLGSCAVIVMADYYWDSNLLLPHIQNLCVTRSGIPGQTFGDSSIDLYEGLQ